MSPRRPLPPLSRREREIMDVVYRLGAPSAAEIAASMTDPPSYSAVRAMLSILVGKGHLKPEADGARYLYKPTVSAKAAQRRALRDVVTNFFQGSPKQALVALLDDVGTLSDGDLEEMRARIEAAKKQGR
ncbi:MAG TPA: BlaI/MecI/CopY family transcriptional regulator [Polyangia bacterium]